MVEIAVKSVFGVKQASVVVLSVLLSVVYSSPFSEKYPNVSTGQPLYSEGLVLVFSVTLT